MSLLLCVAVLLQAQETATVEGQVVNVVTGAPVRKAVVSLAETHPAREAPFIVATDAAGRFVFPEVPQGRYELTAEKAGFDRYLHGRQRDNDYYSPMEVAAGAHVKDLVLRLFPVSTISGQVFDSDGDPIAGATVSILQRSFHKGRRQLLPAGPQASTNEEGEYRVNLFQPGRYWVVAVSAPSILMNARRPSSANEPPEERQGPTFYPSAPDDNAAIPVEIQPGAQLKGIDIRLQPTRVVRIRGRLISPGSLPYGPSVRLRSRDSAWRLDIPSGHVSGEEGKFEVGGVGPGRHTLLSEITIDDRPYYAIEELDVAGEDLNDVRLVLRPSFDIPGRVRFPEGADVPRLDGLFVQLDRADGRQSQGSRVRSDGTFTIPATAPGRCRLVCNVAPEGYYLKAALVGRENVLHREFDVSTATAGIELVFERSQARITAVVGERRGVVVLWPDPWFEGADRLIRHELILESGSVELKSLAPGGYVAFALEKFHHRHRGDPEFLERVKDKLVHVAVGEDTRVTVNLKFIERPELADLP